MKTVLKRLLNGVASCGVACLLGGTVPAAAAQAEVEQPPAATGLVSDEGLTVLEEVIVYGTDGRLIAGMSAESSLDAAGVAAYGVDSIGDLLAQVAPDVDNTEEGPVILVNGKPANGIRSVNDLPTEAVQSVQVLPPQAAAALGYGPTRRVINVVLRNSFGQKQANGTLRGATAGRGVSATANASVLKLAGNNVRNFAVRASKTEPLLEAHRDIRSQLTALPYDLDGNVLSWPLSGGDIDPALSAMTGYPVTVAGVPTGAGTPTLGDFASNANLSNSSDMGRFRTLVADQYSYGINANWGRPLPRRFSLNLNFNIDRSEARSLTGASSAFLHVPASSVYSPFSRDVGVARYIGGPLEQQSDPTQVNFGGSVNGQLGRWQLLSDTSFSWRNTSTLSERRVDTAELQALIDAGTLNPFEPLPAELLDEVLADHAKSRNWTGSLNMRLMGQPFTLPAGKANATLRGELRHNQQRSHTVGTNNVSSRRTRDDRAAYLSMQLPLLGAPTPAAMGMAGELNGAVKDVTASGTLFEYGYGLNARKGNRFTLRIGISHEKVAPQPESLTNPVVTIDDYRAYDFIRQETVLVRYITGGNPDLGVENRRRMRIGGTMRPLTAIDMNFNLDYERMVGRDAISQLPAVSEDVQAAFPDRYRRDATGQLTEIDARLVSFARNETESIRWGGNFRRAFGVPPGRPQPQNVAVMILDGVASTSAGVDELSGAGWRLNANFTHTWQLTNKRLARAGLPEQDLLDGGAGNGASQSRHNVQSRIGLAHDGTGLQLNVNWKGRTRITAGTASDPNDIVFDPLLRLDMTAFANLGTVFPGNSLVEGSRLTLGVENLFDAKQRVQDENGITPLRYQPYLINSLGRTLSLSLRKTF